jgi:hypothetical protein
MKNPMLAVLRGLWNLDKVSAMMLNHLKQCTARSCYLCCFRENPSNHEQHRDEKHYTMLHMFLEPPEKGINQLINEVVHQPTACTGKTQEKDADQKDQSSQIQCFVHCHASFLSAVKRFVLFT